MEKPQRPASGQAANDLVGIEATVGPHRELAGGPAYRTRPIALGQGSGRLPEPCWPDPRADGAISTSPVPGATASSG